MNATKTLGLALAAASLYSCQPQTPVDPHEEELITTVNLELESNTTTLNLNYKDLDGDGGMAPVFILDTLAANTTYSGMITLLNEAETPIEDLTSEIFDEAEEHQFFFSASGNSQFTYSDTDNNGNPLGLTFSLLTGDAGTESFLLVLRHQPDKYATGVSDGDITNAGGETDIEITFDVIIE
jgi:hypothetical protein